ncbi:tol-pal system protein YbgF [bacterium]|nr:tol-pal system protein YbgF [bacterium]
MKKIFTFFLLGVFGFFSITAQAKGESTEDQVAELTRVLDAQSKNLATAMNQLQEVLAQFQKLNGMVDQNSYTITNQQNIIKDNQRRLEVLEDKNHLLVTQLEELKKAGLLPTTAVKSLKEFQTYQQGLGLLNNDNYQGALTALKTFIADNPKSPYVENAQYWVGESLFAMKDFPKAVSEFQRVIKDFPKGSKVAPSLLKQGMSFFEMQSFDDSKAFLNKLITQFPQSNEAIQAQGVIASIDRVLEERAKEAVEKKISAL